MKNNKKYLIGLALISMTVFISKPSSIAIDDGHPNRTARRNYYIQFPVSDKHTNPANINGDTGYAITMYFPG